MESHASIDLLCALKQSERVMRLSLQHDLCTNREEVLSWLSRFDKILSTAKINSTELEKFCLESS